MKPQENLMGIEIFIQRHSEVEILGNFNSIENVVSNTIELRDALNFIRRNVCKYKLIISLFLLLFTLKFLNNFLKVKKVYIVYFIKNK